MKTLLETMKQAKAEAAKRSSVPGRIMAGPRALMAMGVPEADIDRLFGDCLDPESGMYVIDVNKT